jgi:23S rRNA pseudouridine2605 synthase
MDNNFYGGNNHNDGVERHTDRREGDRPRRPRISTERRTYSNNNNINDDNRQYNRTYHSDNGEQRSYNRNYNNGGERRQFNRNNYNNDGGERRQHNRDYNSYNNNGGERRPYNRDYNSYNGDGGERRQFNRDYNSYNNNGGERRSFNRNNYNNDGGERRPFNRNNYNNDGGERRSFNRNNYNNEGGERRPFNRNNYNNEGGERRQANNRNRNGFGGNSNGFNRRPAAKPQGGLRRPFTKKALTPKVTKKGKKTGYEKSVITESLFDENLIVATPEITNVKEAPIMQLRLNRFIAMAGICSRRDADKLISEGLVKVNGEVVTEMGIVVNISDKVEYNGEILTAEKKKYVLLNKPKDTVTTTDDPEARRTVMDLVAEACDERIYPVGRLDRNTTGVLLLTNDGQLAEQLTHPRYGVRKIYHVFLNMNVTQNDMDRMLKGLHLEDGEIAVDDVRYVDANDHKQVGVQIHSGKNRIVRRIFEHLGYEVEKLDRVYFAGLTKLNVPRGTWRFLTDTEVNKLKAGFFK